VDCDAHDSTTTVTETATSTDTPVLATVDMLVHLDYGYNDAQAKSAASAIKTRLALWDHIYTYTTSADESRPTIKNPLPIRTTQCYTSGATPLDADFWSRGIKDACGQLKDSNWSPDHALVIDVPGRYIKFSGGLSSCSDLHTFSQEECESDFNQLKKVCPAGGTFSAGCYRFSALLQFTSNRVAAGVEADNNTVVV